MLTANKTRRVWSNSTDEEALPEIVDHTDHMKLPPPSDTHDKWQEVASMDHSDHYTDPYASLYPIFKHSSGQKFIVRPYHDPFALNTPGQFQISGWSNMATQELFKAGQIKHLCQRSHVDQDSSGRPIVVTHFENPCGQYLFDHHPALDRDASKMMFMDFLCGMPDRHSGNVCFKQTANGFTEHPVAIDHEYNFHYLKYGGRHTTALHDLKEAGAYKENGLNPWSGHGLESATAWWRENGPFVKAEFRRQAKMLKDDKIREFIENNFRYRAEALDRFSEAWQHNKDPHFHSQYEDAVIVPMYKFGE